MRCPYDDWKLATPEAYDDDTEPEAYDDDTDGGLDMFEPEPNYDREDFAAECERLSRERETDDGDD